MYAYHVLSLSLQKFVQPSNIIDFFGKKNGCGHIHVLKTFPRFLLPNIYGFMGLAPFAEIPFFGIFSLTQGMEWPGGTQTMLLTE